MLPQSLQKKLTLPLAVCLPVVVQAIVTLVVLAVALSGSHPAHAALLVALTVVGIALALGIGFAMARKFSRDAKVVVSWLDQFRTQAAGRLTGGMQALADGNLSITFPLTSKSSEIVLAGEFAAMKEMLAGLRQGFVETFIAYNRATERLRELVGAVSESAAGVNEASGQVALTSEEAGRSSGEIAAAISDIASGSEQQARIVDTARAAADDVTDAASTSAAGVGEAVRLADHVREVTEEGVRASSEADGAMTAVRDASHAATTAIGELAENSARIGSIVETITGIADQTNLLALNAAIEAARAGEQGRGFAIVAEEVRKLADQSGRAAEQISALLAAIQTRTQQVVEVVRDGGERTDAGVALVLRAREAFEAIDASARDMHARINEIASSSERVVEGAERLRDMIAEVTTVADRSSESSGEVSASAQQSTASAEQLAATASDLKSNASQLWDAVRRFRIAG